MTSILKRISKSNYYIMDLVAYIYSFFYGNSNWIKTSTNKYFQKGAFLKRNGFYISGKNNEINIGRKARVRNCKFTIIGNNCKVVIGGGHTIVSNVHFWCQENNSTIVIGEHFTMESGHIAATEGKSIHVGKDCMFSDDVEIRNGDSHSIIDTLTNKRINHAAHIIIEDHVWLTAHVRILKGSVIPSNSIVGNSSVVSAKFEAKNALYSGVPCRLIKENIDWNRYMV